MTLTVRNGKNVKCSQFLVAETLEKANTYVLAEMVVHNPKVGGSIPPPATSNLNLQWLTDTEQTSNY